MTKIAQSCSHLQVQAQTFVSHVKYGRFDKARDIHPFTSLSDDGCRSFLLDCGIAGEQIDAFLLRRQHRGGGGIRRKPERFKGYRLGDVSDLAV